MSYCTFIYSLYVYVSFRATLTEVFPCFFLSCKATARVNPAKMGHGPHPSYIFVLFYVLFVCKCVLFYWQRVATQLQLIKYIIYHWSKCLVWNHHPHFNVACSHQHIGLGTGYGGTSGTRLCMYVCMYVRTRLRVEQLKIRSC
jgi:hypothetical protein